MASELHDRHRPTAAFDADHDAGRAPRRRLQPAGDRPAIDGSAAASAPAPPPRAPHRRRRSTAPVRDGRTRRGRSRARRPWRRAEVREPHRRRAPTSSRRRSAESSSSRSDACSLRSRLSPSPPASSSGSSSVSRNTSASTLRLPSNPRPRMRSGTHGSSVGMVAMIGVLSPARLAELGGAPGVELGGHEHRAALGVEVEHLGRVRATARSRSPAPTRRPRRPRPSSTVMSRASISVSRMISTSAAACLATRRHLRRTLGRRDLLGEALQRPVATPLHLRRHVGQRDDRAHRLALAGELEGGHVALDPVVVGGERRRAHQFDGAVLADEAAAGGGDAGRTDDRRRDRQRGGDDRASLHIRTSPGYRTVTDWTPAPWTMAAGRAPGSPEASARSEKHQRSPGCTVRGVPTLTFARAFRRHVECPDAYGRRGRPSATSSPTTSPPPAGAHVRPRRHGCGPAPRHLVRRRRAARPRPRSRTRRCDADDTISVFQALSGG